LKAFEAQYDPESSDNFDGMREIIASPSYQAIKGILRQMQQEVISLAASL
jgi:hypothetical protein